MSRKSYGKLMGVLAATAAASLVFSGCGAGSSSSDNSIKVMYWSTSSAPDSDRLFKQVKKDMEKKYPDANIQLQVVAGSEEDYNTKVALAFRSASTAPDVIYEDTSQMGADVEAGYLMDIGSYVDQWNDWDKFIDSTKKSVTYDGKIYGVPLSTDTRAIWYNKDILQKAGVEVPWQPKSWDDILDMAVKVKAYDASITPFNIYAGTTQGEGTVMQGFYQLLFGTKLGDNALYDSAKKKWVIGSQGFKDSLEFTKTLYEKGYAPSVSDALDTNLSKKMQSDWFPNGKMAATVEGSWYPSSWAKGGSYEWDGYDKTMAVAAFPTENGGDPGFVSMSGGWAIGVGSKSKNPKLAFEFVQEATSAKNSMEYYTNYTLDINPRSDVTSDPENQPENPYVKDATNLVQYTHYRPGLSMYSKVSNEVQKATESVITGKASADQAAQTYDQAVAEIVGEDNVIKE